MSLGQTEVLLQLLNAHPFLLLQQLEKLRIGSTHSILLRDRVRCRLPHFNERLPDTTNQAATCYYLLLPAIYYYRA